MFFRRINFSGEANLVEMSETFRGDMLLANIAFLRFSKNLMKIR